MTSRPLPTRRRACAVRPVRMACAIALLTALGGKSMADETIFKKVEADGSVTFTDQPLPDAEITEGSPISVVGASPPAAPPTATAPITTPGAAAAAAVDEPDVTSASMDAAMPQPSDLPEITGESGPLDTGNGPADETAGDRATGNVAGADNGGAPASSPDLPVIAGLSIAAPPDGSTVIDAGQTISVLVVADPPGEAASRRLQAEISVDGTVVAAGPLGTLDVPMPERGEHVLSARVFDMTGEQLAESEPSVLYVQKPARP